MAGKSIMIRGDSGVVIIEGVLDGGSNTGVVTSEKLSLKNRATSNPIENGSDINDHVVIDPTSFSISGILVNGDSGRLTLEAMRDNRDLLEYSGDRELDNLVILSLDQEKTADNANGVTFSITFQRMNLVSSQKASVKPTMTQQDSAATTPENVKAKSKQGTKTVQTAASQSSSSSSSSPSDSVSVSSYNSSFQSKINAKLGK